ncbi:MAG: hypothetical protein AMK69_16825 [Nitrospira bacterium SG8_3]|nr:MAG: hypothetical protein AMK69_16825 [Nitrospira bacterium SG8_3]
MALHTNRNWMPAFCLVGVQIFVYCFLSPAFANQELAAPPGSFLEQHRAQILQLSSDNEALAFFQSITNPQVAGSRLRTQSQSSPTNPNLAKETKEAVTTYLASLAGTAHAQEIRKSIVGSTTASSPSSEAVTGEAQLQWITQQSPLQPLKLLMDFYEQISAWSQATSEPLPPGNNFAEFAAYYDQTYPDWDNRPLSWASIFQQHGQKGIEARLLEYWQAPDQLAKEHASSPSTHQAYAQHYIGTRLLPMFRANLLTQSIRLETTAYETAWENWRHIQQWQQHEQTKSATTRLCGTWQWLVHNHQNHGDHKMMITFSPPDQSSPSQLEPSTIVIQGDTVYLKWTFPQGIQEDSLLLSNHDTHLEGTFKNSLGPHGSISGKRLSTCRS